MKPTRPAEPGPLRLAHLLWAPHRLGFFLAAVNLLAVSGWWAWFNALRWTGHPGMALPPGWLHAQLMVGAFMPLYFIGFLFTAGPRWLNVTAPTAPQLLRGSVALCAGWWVAAIGAYWHPVWTSAGLLLSLLGWLDLLVRFIGLLRQSRQEDTLHARLIAVSGCVGAVLLAVSAVALQQGAWPLWHATLLGLLWFWIAPVFVVALHRMIPFFTAAAMPALDAWRPNWLLWTLLSGLWAQGVLHVGDALGVLPRATLPGYVRPALALPWGLLVIALGVRWGLVQSLRIRLLAMLHLGFVWLGVAFLLELHADPLLAVHALGIGALGSLLMAMVTRVSCGHGGRTLVADDFVWAVFLALQGVAVTRLVAQLWPAASPWLTPAAAWAWLAVLGVWSVRLIRWYLRPRRDGRPG